MKDNRLCVGDEDVNVSWTQLKEENERLQNEVTAYKHELESNKKDNDLLEAQVGDFSFITRFRCRPGILQISVFPIARYFYAFLFKSVGVSILK